jgi:uncharacterized membrane protein YhhN
MDGDLLFLGGLGSFLLAHWFYIFAMNSDYHTTAFLPGILAYAFAFCFFSLLMTYGPEAELVAPVALYALTIATMAWAAFRRVGSRLSTPSSQRFAAVGALLFVVSDSILGFNKFAVPLPHGKFMIMVTYYSAQVCLALSTNGVADKSLLQAMSASKKAE